MCEIGVVLPIVVNLCYVYLYTFLCIYLYMIIPTCDYHIASLYICIAYQLSMCNYTITYKSIYIY